MVDATGVVNMVDTIKVRSAVDTFGMMDEADAVVVINAPLPICSTEGCS